MSDIRRLYLIRGLSIVVILAIIIFTGVGIGAFIDIPTLGMTMLLIIIARNLSKQQHHSFLIGSIIMMTILGISGILANINSLSEVPITVAVILIFILYTVVYIYLLSKPQEILLSNNIVYNKELLSFSKKEYIFQVLFLVVIGINLYFMGKNVGLMTIVDVSSMFIFIPLLATYKMKNKLKKLLIQQNILLGFTIISFMIFCISVLVNSSATIVGPVLALTLMTSLYSLYYYLAWIKPLYFKIEYDNISFEYKFYILTTLFMIISFSFTILLAVK
jgi:hypothetical protein